MKITDKKRLDWLGSTDHSTFEFNPQMTGGVFVFGSCAEEVGGNPYEGVYYPTLRRAVDVQIKLEEKIKKLRAIS